MRPPEFTGGNPHDPLSQAGAPPTASMRPPEFTGGNALEQEHLLYYYLRFNEAAGIHRRKRDNAASLISAPPDGFNEAAGIHRRKHA